MLFLILVKAVLDGLLFLLLQNLLKVFFLENLLFFAQPFKLDSALVLNATLCLLNVIVGHVVVRFFVL